MKTHDVKSWPDFFAPVLSGAKNFELRNNDRHYQVGDLIRLREFDDRTGKYTGRDITKRITYVFTSSGPGAPVHRACADLALVMCPHLQRNNCAQDLTPFPDGYSILSSIVGGALTDEDFGVKINGRRVVGHLKIAWPQSRMRVIRNREPVMKSPQ